VVATAPHLATTKDSLRQQVQEFIARKAPPGECHDGVRVPRDAEAERALRRWYVDLFDAGYMGGSWPPAHGGREDHSPYDDAVVMEEIVRARAPRPIDQVLLAAHLIIQFGTDAQRARYLPRIRSAQDIWCQLLSEPGVGSDLARLSTKAVPSPEGGFRVDGQKVWSTDAQWSQMGVLLARTDPTAARPHAGLTMFALDMSTPGVDVRPIREMTGSAEFCEVYLDGVIVPAENVIGEVNKGWAVANSGLASERVYVGANAVILELLFDDLIELARNIDYPGGAAIDDPVVRDTLAHIHARVAAVQHIARRAVERLAGGTDQPADGLIAKLAYTELNVAICCYAINLPVSGRLRPGGRDVYARWQQAFLWSRALTISGGSSEIVRNVLATQLFGFPRSW
jgi:alkylation response protein AidB-like acyl-CoA dehydrogenase